MKKRLLSAVLALVLCAYPTMAADFDTLTISSDREVIDDSVLYELAEADEPSTLTLRTPNGETGLSDVRWNKVSPAAVRTD